MNDLPLDATDLTWLRSLARALISEPNAADDLVQETAVAAILGPLPPNAPRRAWLAGVARRLAARRYRSEIRRGDREELAARPEALPDSAELVEKAELAEHVTAAVRQLPEPYRRTILLRFLEGLSAEEIAREEGKPADSIRWRVRRGLELLRGELVRRHDRDWSSWSVLLLPLARTHGDAGLATAGASGVLTGTVVSVAVMKAITAVALVLGCVGLWFVWNSNAEEPVDASVATEAPAVAIAPVEVELEPEVLPVAPEPLASRTEVQVEPEPVAAAVELLDLVGQVVDEGGAVVAGATVFLVPSVEQGQDKPPSDEVRAQAKSDQSGRFRFAPEAWESGAADEPLAFDLGVVANGYLRSVVPAATLIQPRDELTVVLERGRTLSGRVIDESGRPVAGLQLVAFTANSGVGHVSPSQRLLRADRRVLAGSSSSYEDCRATTDDSGEVVFAGLPAGELGVLPVAPGWLIEEPERVESNDTYVTWTAKRCLGVRLLVTDASTGRPADLARATFGFECTFADGEVQDYSEWVGRGAGEVTFVVGPDLMLGLEGRTITRADFYGTVRVGDGEAVEWSADPIEDIDGAVGVVEVEVEASSTSERLVVADDGTVEEVGTARLELDVRYEDAAPFEGGLTVLWVSKSDYLDRDSERADRIGAGSYAIDIPAGDWTIVVEDRFASGSLPAWSGDFTLVADEPARAVVTLSRGAVATVMRPDGWSGEWFLRASWRASEEDEWFGSWGHSTEADSLTLPALQPAQWRFELRQDLMADEEPLVWMSDFLEDGESVTVDG